MEKNFWYGIAAIGKHIALYLESIFHNSSFLGFILGVFVTTVLIGFVLTENPTHIPLMLRYSSFVSFHKINARHPNGTFSMAYTTFVNLYTKIRILFLVALITFFIMVGTITLFSK